jgi:hypothetical protein
MQLFLHSSDSFLQWTAGALAKCPLSLITGPQEKLHLTLTVQASFGMFTGCVHQLNAS